MAVEPARQNTFQVLLSLSPRVWRMLYYFGLVCVIETVLSYTNESRYLPVLKCLILLTQRAFLINEGFLYYYLVTIEI